MSNSRLKNIKNRVLNRCEILKPDEYNCLNINALTIKICKIIFKFADKRRDRIQ